MRGFLRASAHVEGMARGAFDRFWPLVVLVEIGAAASAIRYLTWTEAAVVLLMILVPTGAWLLWRRRQNVA